MLKLLHERCTELKKEVRERLGTDTVIKPVLRTYAFEDERIPAGPQWVLKVVCNAAPGSIRADLAGRNFSAVLGTSQTPLEALQLKRKIMGPCWLSLTNAVKEEAQSQLSWCKVRCLLRVHTFPKQVGFVHLGTCVFRVEVRVFFLVSDAWPPNRLLHAAVVTVAWVQLEYSVNGHKAVTPAAKQAAMPPIKIASVNIKTVPDSSDAEHEIVAVSVLHTMMRTDQPLDVDKWKRANSIRRFTVMCPPQGTVSPAGLQNHVKVQSRAAPHARLLLLPHGM